MRRHFLSQKLLPLPSPPPPAPSAGMPNVARGSHCKATYSPFRPPRHLGEKRVLGWYSTNPTKTSSQGLPHPGLRGLALSHQGPGPFIPYQTWGSLPGGHITPSSDLATRKVTFPLSHGKTATSGALCPLGRCLGPKVPSAHRLPHLSYVSLHCPEGPGPCVSLPPPPSQPLSPVSPLPTHV